MSSRALLAVAVLLVGLPAVAQGNSLVGTVVNIESGRPAVGIEVQLLRGGAPTGLAARTDAHGRYRLVGVPPGRYALDCGSQQFEDVSPPIEVDARADRTLRVNREVLPRGYFTAMLVPLPSPVVDIGTTSSTWGLEPSFRRLLPLFSR